MISLRPRDRPIASLSSNQGNLSREIVDAPSSSSKRAFSYDTKSALNHVERIRECKYSNLRIKKPPNFLILSREAKHTLCMAATKILLFHNNLQKIDLLAIFNTWRIQTIVENWKKRLTTVCYKFETFCTRLNSTKVKFFFTRFEQMVSSLSGYELYLFLCP